MLNEKESKNLKSHIESIFKIIIAHLLGKKI